jgi:hypothetical protein
MIGNRCTEFDQRLRDPHWAGDREGLTAWLQGLKGVEGCVADGLQRAGAAEDWLAFEHYLLAAYHHPSRAFTKGPFEVFGRQVDEVNNEDIVDVLAEIADPAAVGCLEEALWWQPPWDEYRQLAVNVFGRWLLSGQATQ